MSEQCEIARTFACFGGQAGVLVAGTAPDGTTASLAALLTQARLLDVHRRLSRFDAASELSCLNASDEPVVTASPLLRRLARAVVHAGMLSDGLVDATRLDALERAGYGASRAGVPGVPPAELLDRAPAPRPARAHPDRAWEWIVVDDRERTITRPVGLRVDSGGLAKGLAADIAAEALAAHPAFAVDCAGDIRIGGCAGRPRPLLVEDPFGGPALHSFLLRAGAAATSGIGRRSWRGEDEAPAHHLIDPATGRPAWTGVLQATALAPTALEAEILAKAALLAGPRDGVALLRHGGVLVLADRSVLIAGERLELAA